MKDLPVVRALTSQGVAFCLIGAHALSVWGYTRNSVDIALLKLDDRVLVRVTRVVQAPRCRA